MNSLRKTPVYNRPGGPQCNICLRRFYGPKELRRHKDRIHNPNKTNDYECPKCHKMFSTKSNLIVHNKTVHLKLRAYSCEDCGRSFGRNDDLRAHIRMVHDKVRSAPCFHCGKTYSSDRNLLHHTERVHEKLIRNPRPCARCSYIAPSPSALRYHHIALHTPYRFGCAFGCERVYSSAGNLGTYHLKKKIHKINKKYALHAVLKFKDAPKLPEMETQPIACLFCDMRFENKKFLKVHMIYSHC